MPQNKSNYNFVFFCAEIFYEKSSVLASMGDSINSVSSIFENSILSNVEVSDIAGGRITNYLKDLIRKESNSIFLETDPDIEDLDFIKRHHCEIFVERLDYSFVELKNSTFLCTEILFNPKLIDSNSISIQKMKKSKPKELQKDLFGNIFIEHFGSLFPGLLERLQLELDKLKSFYYSDDKIVVKSFPERK